MYTVFGYDDMCEDFVYVFDSFVEAVKAFRNLSPFCVAFIMRESRLLVCTLYSLIRGVKAH